VKLAEDPSDERAGMEGGAVGPVGGEKERVIGGWVEGRAAVGRAREARAVRAAVWLAVAERLEGLLTSMVGVALRVVVTLDAAVDGAEADVLVDVEVDEEEDFFGDRVMRKMAAGS